ncbi:phosphate transport system permease protein [Deinobacterium chartae]|uniref:Phosphate transport system permease protein PstA n=1 Tax=Deinobacterium chartae TaxID=521158 RepID=A0A841I5M0_9DEIO|nr:phosphate ABC transporter permease PstA [Deinobacterium chartae]MBB6099232.1 phosphate transport system permease protein [Deinobacterium chartae]
MTTHALAQNKVGDGKRRSRTISNAIAAGFIALGTLIVLLPLFAVFYYLIAQGLSSIDLNFFTKLPVPVGEEGGGLANAIVGTIILVALASILGVTVGVGGGIFLAEYSENKLVPYIRLVADVLSGIPAIVMGLVSYGLVVMTTGKFSAISGGIALGFLMVPIIVRTTEEVLKLVPLATREAGLALGLPRWRVIMSIVLPTALGGIVTGVMLSVARVAGEAAPLLFTAFGNQFWNVFNLDQPISALPLVIYNYASSPYEEWHRLASAAALVLVVMVFLTTLIARIATRRR